MGKNNKNKNKNPQSNHGNVNKQIHNNNGNNNMTELEINEPEKPPRMPPKDSKYPFVSICTPTFNRRPFIPAMLKCFEHQTYPKHRMEWIIIDDGTDKIEDLVKHHPNVRYFKYDEKMTLGKKRNLVHDKSIGDILVYMDDDDYYPPERVSHAVETLQANPHALCAGSSEIYIYFKHIEKMYQFGPYKDTHATAGTFAFRRELLKNNRYEEEACLAEEKAFLKDYTVPLVQLNPQKVILVFSHEQNTFDKRKLLENPNQFVKESSKTIDDFIKQPELKEFYLNIDSKLENYSPGDASMKPDVLKQMLQMEEKRRKAAEDQAKNCQQITIQQNGGPPTVLTTPQVVELIKQQQTQIQGQATRIAQLQQLNTTLLAKLKTYGEAQPAPLPQPSVETDVQPPVPQLPP
jgi:hypothetical protein